MAINAKRLLKLADYLETVPRKAFDISSWQANAANKPEGKRPGECGFAGCAVGWAAHAKLFRGLSLKTVPDRSDLIPAYRSESDWAALDSLFGFDRIDHVRDSGQAEYLFWGPKYDGKPTPKQVAKRIRKFVRDNQASAP